MTRNYSVKRIDSNYKNGKRCVILGEYIVENNGTVREAAAYFGVSKSTVHKDVTAKLRDVDSILYEKVGNVLSKNKAERHLRGGMATRKKYLNRKSVYI